MNTNEGEEVEKVGWNLSMALIMELTNNLHNANRYYLEGNPTKAFFCLKAVKMRIIHNLSFLEREHCLIMEGDFLKQKAMQTPDKPAMTTNAYEKFNEFIMDLLCKYGYTETKKEDETDLVM